VQDEKRLHVVDRDQWRAWLERNHKVVKGVWLVSYKKHTRKPTIPYNDAVEEALCFGWIDSIIKRLDDEKYMQRYTPRKKKSVWSELNKRRVRKMIRQGRMTEAGLAAIREAKKNGQWTRRPKAADAEAIPPELSKALAANKKAGQNFDKLAPSYRRQYIGWFLSAKRDETRKKRLKEIVRLLSQNKKLGLR
jgi:uncharacterized protein YdeI (YjbR/CyaY-like superfamily)